MTDTREWTDAEVSALVSDAFELATRVASLREFLAIQAGGGATVTRIEATRAIFGWDNDPAIVVTPKRLRPLSVTEPQPTG